MPWELHYNYNLTTYDKWPSSTLQKLLHKNNDYDQYLKCASLLKEGILGELGFISNLFDYVVNYPHPTKPLRILLQTKIQSNI